MKLFRRNTASRMPSPSIRDTDSPIAMPRGSAGGALVERATEFYRRNPKTVGGVALIGAAALLGLVKNRGLRRGP